MFLQNLQYRTHNRAQQTTGKAHLNVCKHKIQLVPSAGSGSYYEEILYTQEIHLSWIPQAAGKSFIRTNDSAFFHSVFVMPPLPSSGSKYGLKNTWKMTLVPLVCSLFKGKLNTFKRIT